MLIMACLCNHKSTMLVYMILNGKGHLKQVVAYMGTVLFPFFFFFFFTGQTNKNVLNILALSLL